MHGFHVLDSRLLVDDVDLGVIAHEAGTPVYVYSGALVRQRYRELTRALGDYPHAVHFAMKANSTLAIVRLLVEEGAALDANSIGEIEVALRAGCAPQDLVFTGVGKRTDELERAIAIGVKAINVESAGELGRVASLAAARGTRARVAIRVNPDVDARSHPHISTGLRGNKFGIPLDDVRELCRAVVAQPELHLVGVHVHIGSQMLDLAPLVQVAETLRTLVDGLKGAGIVLEHLDLGGGLGVAYDGSPGPQLADYARLALDAVRPTGLELILEPGRALLAPAGVLVTRVVDVKRQAGGRWFAVVDAAMTDLLRPALYGAFHRIEAVDAAPGRPRRCVDVVGPVCESSDAFGTDRELPVPEVGELLAIRDVGAYGSVMASNYNRRPMPPEVLVEGGAWRLIRRRQTIDDLLQWEV